MSVARPTISRLPAIALARPPAVPGGGVISVNSVSESAPTPALITVSRIQPSQNKPNNMADMDRVSATWLMILRLSWMFIIGSYELVPARLATRMSMNLDRASTSSVMRNNSSPSSMRAAV